MSRLQFTKTVSNTQPHWKPDSEYFEAMAAERRKKRMDPGFYSRFTAITDAAEAIGITKTDLASIMGKAGSTITRLRAGDPASIRFEDGLRLCERFGIDPWRLAFGRPRSAPSERLRGQMLESLQESPAPAHSAPAGETESLPPNVEELVAEAVAERMKPILARLRKIDQALSQPSSKTALRQRK